MYWFVAVSLVFLGCCHGVPLHGEDAHLGPESPANADVKSGGAAAGGSMIRTESSRSRKTKKHTGTMFEVKPSGELKYHSDSSGAVPDTGSTMDVTGKVDAVQDANSSAGVDDVAVTAVITSGENAKHDEATALNASGADGPQSASASSGSLVGDHANSTEPVDLAALPMEKLALLQGGQQSNFPVHGVPKNEANVVDYQRKDQLPGERLIGELLQEGGQDSAKDLADQTRAEDGGSQIPGLGNVGDLAFRAMDMMLGTTGIVVEDYPFACICNAYGVCERDIQNTPCPRRAGQMAAARRSVSIGTTVAFLAAAVFTVQIFC